ncbi:hypothetical protein D3C76_1441420 [compost metagenome]
MLWRRGFIQFQARHAVQFAGSLLDDDIELFAQCPGVGLSEVPRGLDALAVKVFGHPPANAPDIADLAGLQQPIAARGIANIEHAARFSLPFFGPVIRQLGQRLAGRDSNANGNAGAAQDLGADLAAKARHVAW